MDRLDRLDRFVPDDRKFPTVHTIDHPKYQAKIKCFANPSDTVCKTILEGEIWEQDLFDHAIKPYVKPNTCVLDCGAYVGSHSILISKIDPSVDVLAFEMMPEHFKIIHDNIRLNRISNMLVFNCALSESNGQLEIPEVDYQKEEHVNFGRTSLKDTEKEDTPVHVPAMALDTFLPWIKKPLSVIKMDVEGHEIQALNGARNILSTFRPVVVVEIWKDKYDAFQKSDLWRFMSRQLGYTMRRIHNDDYLLKC